MFFKVATFLTLAVFMVQLGEVKPQYSPDPLINRMIGDFLTNANNTLQSAIIQTGLVAQQFNAQLKEFDTKVQGFVSKICTDLDSQIALEVAKQNGVFEKIYNCTALQKPKLDEFTNATFQSLRGCATEKIELGITSVNNIFKALSDLYNTAVNATQRLNTRCPAPPQGASISTQFIHMSCVTNTIATITYEINSHALTISLNAVTVGTLIVDIPNFPTQYATCLTTRTTGAMINALPIVGSIVGCTLTP